MLYAPLAILALLALFMSACSSHQSRHADHALVIVPVERTSSAWNEQTPVGRIVTEQPDAARIFDLVGIDYCCGGDTPLGEAAAAKSISPRRLLDALAVIGGRMADNHGRNFDDASVDEVIDHIVMTYHAELRTLLPRLDEIMATVVEVHGMDHAELAEVQRVFRDLRAELESHMADEENRAFPAIRELADGRAVENLHEAIDVLYDDHDEAAAALRTLNALTDGYTPPAGACNLYRQMLTALDHLERQMMKHVHLENSVLFPKAMSIEAGRAAK